MQVSLHQLRIFVAIADAGGFARAAKRLNLSQPAASRQIHALERRLGVPLFDRVGRRVQLTSEGEDLLLRSRHLLAEASALGERAQALRGGERGVLRVGAPPHVIETVFAGFLARHRRRFPGVEVHLVEDGGASLPSRLERGELHLTVMPVGDERFHGALFAPVYALAVMPERHRLARRRTLEIAELAEEPLLLPRREFGSRVWFDAACHAARIAPRMLLESAAPHTLVALATEGYGIGIVPSNMRLPPRGFRALPLLHRGAAVGRWTMLGWDPRRFLAPYAERFAEELLAHVRRAEPGRAFTRHAPPLPKPVIPGPTAGLG
jgi:LysR family cyn operon transcriptional activator